MFVVTGKRQLETLVVEHIGQGGQLPTHLLCPLSSRQHCCLPYRFSASKLIFPFRIELIRIIMYAASER